MIRGSQSRVLDDMRHDLGKFFQIDGLGRETGLEGGGDIKELVVRQGGQKDILHSIPMAKPCLISLDQNYGYLSFSVFLFLPWRKRESERKGGGAG
eukprot:sb/3479198/